MSDTRLMYHLRGSGFGMAAGGVILRPADARWAGGAAALVAALPAGARWTHVGSTSVPSLPAKPIADILGVVSGAIDELEGPLVALGFTWLGEYGIPGRRFVRLRVEEVDYAHLHLFPEQHPGPAMMLRFRDRLVADPAAREAYARLKEAQAAAHAASREAYTDGKAAFIAALLA